MLRPLFRFLAMAGHGLLTAPFEFALLSSCAGGSPRPRDQERQRDQNQHHDDDGDDYAGRHDTSLDLLPTRLVHESATRDHVRVNLSARMDRTPGEGRRPRTTLEKLT
jgi:hypothetical protein